MGVIGQRSEGMQISLSTHSLSKAGGRISQHRKESERVMGAYELLSAEGGISIHSKGTNDGHSLSVKRRGYDKSAQRMQVRAIRTSETGYQ